MGLSFEIKNSKDFFATLLQNFEDFKKDKTSSIKAINCCMIAWHLIDWIYHDNNYKALLNFNSPQDLQKALKEKCPSLQIMRDITDGTKHFYLTCKPKIKETKLHSGAFSSGFSRAFDISTLEIEMEDGTKKYFEDEIEIVVNFWTECFQTTFNLFRNTTL